MVRRRPREEGARVSLAGDVQRQQAAKVEDQPHQLAVRAVAEYDGVEFMVRRLLLRHGAGCEQIGKALCAACQLGKHHLVHSRHEVLGSSHLEDRADTADLVHPLLADLLDPVTPVDLPAHQAFLHQPVERLAEVDPAAAILLLEIDLLQPRPSPAGRY